MKRQLLVLALMYSPVTTYLQFGIGFGRYDANATQDVLANLQQRVDAVRAQGGEECPQIWLLGTEHRPRQAGIDEGLMRCRLLAVRDQLIADDAVGEERGRGRDDEGVCVCEEIKYLRYLLKRMAEKNAKFARSCHEGASHLSKWDSASG